MTDFKFPLISVLVPVYNAEPFLVMCLDSIFAQTGAIRPKAPPDEAS